MVLGVLLIQDVLLILLLAALLRWDGGLPAIESGVLRSVLLLFSAWLCAYTIVPRLLTRLALDDEALLIVVLGILFVFTGAAWWLDVPLVTGAFSAGFAVSSFPVNAVIRGQLRSLNDFFIAVFFVALGASLAMPGLSELLFSLTLIGLVVLVTPLLVIWAAERAGMTARAAIESGLMLAQTSELSLVVVLLGAGAGHVDAGMLGAVALVTVTTMILTPSLVTERNTLRLLHLHPNYRRRQLPALDARNHILLLGCGSHTRRMVRDWVRAGERVVVVDDDPAVVARLQHDGIPAIRGDAVDPDVLERAGAAGARVIVSTLRRHADNVHIIRQFPGIPVLVRVFETANARAIEQAGGKPIRYSDAAAGSFLQWFDDRSGAFSIPAGPSPGRGAPAPASG